MNCQSGIVVLLIVSVVSTGEGLKCPSCVYVAVDADIPELAQTAVDGLLDLFSDPECEIPLTGPVAGIDEDTCSADDGRVSRCSYYKGHLTVSLTPGIVGSDLHVQVYKQGCYYASPEIVPANGCHDRRNIDEDKSTFQHILDLTKSIASLLGVINFEGDLCLCTDSYCDYTVTSGVPQGAVFSYLLFIVSTIISMVIKTF